MYAEYCLLSVIDDVMKLNYIVSDNAPIVLFGNQSLIQDQYMTYKLTEIIYDVRCNESLVCLIQSNVVNIAPLFILFT